MPRVMIWNIENYGSISPSYRGNYECLHEFIKLVMMNQVGTPARVSDVLIIQEAKKGSVALLPALATDLGFLGASRRHSKERQENVLGPNWDLVKGALLVADATTADQLQYAEAAHNEGYGVVWRTGVLQEFDHVHRSERSNLRGGACFLDLVLEIAEPEAVPSAAVPIHAAAVGGKDSAVFPRRQSGPVGVTRRSTRSTPATDDLIAAIAWRTGVRFPSRCQVLSGGKVVNVVTYHAPNGTSSAPEGVMLASLALELGELKGDGGAVFAGDFNLRTPSQRPAAFGNLPSFHRGTSYGTGTTPADGAYAKTSVRYVNRSGTLSSSYDSCFGDANDYWLGSQAYEGGVLDLLSLIRGRKANQAVCEGIFGSDSPIRALVTAGVAAWKADSTSAPPALRPHLDTIIPNFESDFGVHGAGSFTTWVTAAVFLRVFVSDHLPLYVDV